MLAIKEAGVGGAWLSFYRWSHNITEDEILEESEANIVITVKFSGLKKDWRDVISSMGSVLGKVIATRDGQAGGIPVVRLLVPRSAKLPVNIALSNLHSNKPPIVQKTYYQGLPYQCFLRHLGRDCPNRQQSVEVEACECPKLRQKEDVQASTRNVVNEDGGTGVLSSPKHQPKNEVQVTGHEVAKQVVGKGQKPDKYTGKYVLLNQKRNQYLDKGRKQREGLLAEKKGV